MRRSYRPVGCTSRPRIEGHEDNHDATVTADRTTRDDSLAPDTLPARRGIRWRDVIAVAIIGGVAILPNMLGPLYIYDGGLAASAGTFMLHGELPYRDFWWLYGPASGVLVAIPTAILGPSLLLPRLLGLIVLMSQAGIGYALLRTKVAHVPAAIVAIAAVTPEAFLMHIDVSAWSVSLALALGAIFVRTGTSKRPIWAGVLLGAAFLARLDVGGYGLLAVLLLPGRRQVIAGFAAVAVPFLAFEALTTPLSDLYEQLVWFPIIGTREFRTVPVADLSDRIVLLLLLPVIVIPKAAIAAAVGRILATRNPPPQFLVLTAFATLCQLQTFARADDVHQSQAATAGFLLLGLWVMDGPSGTRRDRAARSVHRVGQSIALAVVGTLCAFAFVSGSLSIKRVQSGPLQAGDAGFIAGVRTLIANTSNDDPVYVGLTNHRYTFLNPMLAYYLADRRSGVRVAMFNPGITNTDLVQQEMVDNLVSSGTQLLLLNETFASTFEASNSSRIPGSTVLDEFIASRYVERCNFGDTRILGSRDRTSAVDCIQPTDEGLVDVLTSLGPGR
jgi:hypothetical protein